MTKIKFASNKKARFLNFNSSLTFFFFFWDNGGTFINKKYPRELIYKMVRENFQQDFTKPIKISSSSPHFPTIRLCIKRKTYITIK